MKDNHILPSCPCGFGAVDLRGKIEVIRRCFGTVQRFACVNGLRRRGSLFFVIDGLAQSTVEASAAFAFWNQTFFGWFHNIPKIAARKAKGNRELYQLAQALI